MFRHAKHGIVDVVGCDGPIDDLNSEQFAVFARERAARGQRRLVVDLCEVPFISSQGLETILQLHEECIQRGGQLQLASPTALVHEILDVTATSDAVEVFDEVAQAVGSFGR